MKVLLLVGFLLVLGQAEETPWSIFQVENKKLYQNETERKLRQSIFNENLLIIEEHNKRYEQGLVSYKLGVNKFADLTDKEFAAKFKTLEAGENNLQNGQEKYDSSKSIPDSIDWRSKSVVTEVKDQAACGGCWAFSATGTIESHFAIQTGQLKSLSEQQILDCDGQNLGCLGGIVQLAINYTTKNGITLEENYPFEGVQRTCSTSKSKPIVLRTNGYVNIIQNNEIHLKQVVGLIGPVSVAINSVPIKLYKEGIFDGTCSNELDHAVLAVGYGTDNKTGVPYWIIKNSWGKDWGDRGYFKLRMGKNLCGVAKQACYPILEPNSGQSAMGNVFLFLFIFITYFCLNISVSS